VQGAQGPTGPSPTLSNWDGVFTDSTTQAISQNAITIVGYNTTESSNGVSVSGGNTIVFANAGVYNI
jgi:hypothetical protein